MTIGNLKLYDIFRKDLHLSDAKAMEVVCTMDEYYERKSSAKTDQLATKAELSAVKSELKEDIGKVRSELKEDISKLRSELKEDIGQLRVELKTDIKDLESRQMKHLHSATILQYFLLVGSIAALLRYAGILK